MNDNHHRWVAADWFALGVLAAAIIAMVVQLWVIP